MSISLGATFAFFSLYSSVPSFSTHKKTSSSVDIDKPYDETPKLSIDHSNVGKKSLNLLTADLGRR